MKYPALFALTALAVLPLHAQTHVTAHPDKVVRAVAVYEWTGEESKATASRLVPVTVFINDQFQDAGVYLARPIPFALQTGNLFSVRKSGIDEGTLELAYARHRITTDIGSYDDGWLAVGSFKPRAVVLAKVLKPGPIPKIEGANDTAGGDAHPGFHNKPAKVDRTGAVNSGTVSAKDDPAHPTGTPDENSDVERPTLKKTQTREQAHAAAVKKNQAAVLSTGDLNDDPDRPNLHRGKPGARMEESDLPPLNGIPPGMHQRVAVSDAADRPEHDFTRPWASDAERAEILGLMQKAARTELQRYGFAPAPALPAPVATPLPAGASRKHKGTVTLKPAPPLLLTDEHLDAYTLSYGGAPTYVYSAQSAGQADVARYIAIVAQRDPLGSLKVALASTTDASHLDRTPWFRLVDAVDAEASNRASLLFELRGQTTRQFALYRVIGGQADQIFATRPN